MDRLEVKAQIAIDDAGSITGIAWPFSGPDSVGDVIEKGAFGKIEAPLPMLASHDQRDVVGVWEEVSETDQGLVVKGRLLVGEVARADEIRALVKAGAMRGLSIGFSGTKAMPRRSGGRLISKVDLREISVVAVPAHPGAKITSAKAHPMDNPNDLNQKLEAKANEFINKADHAALNARLNELEAKMNRPENPVQHKETSLERKAFAAYLHLGNNMSAEDQKALTVSNDAQGGYLAPAEMSSEIIRDLIEHSPIRAYASVSSTSAPSTAYPTRTSGTNAKWVGETEEREESNVGFGQTEIAVKELSTFVDISNRLLADAPQAEAEVRLSLSEDFGKKEAHAFLYGDGIKQPSGLMRHADIAHTANGHATNLSADALINLLYALPATYRNAGAWAMNGTTLAAVRKLKDGDGRFLWQPSYTAGQPEMILGRPVIEMLDMEDLAANTFPIIYGDFKGYRILDRESMSILVDPYTRATNGLTRVHSNRRVGGGVLQAARFRKLKMSA